MLSTESMIIIAIVVVAISALGYYCYYKISTHEQFIGSIHQRCQNIELMLTQPPASEIDSVFNKKQQVCKDGMCYLKPIIEEEEEKEEETEDEMVVQEEVDRLATAIPKKKKGPSLPPPPKSTIEDE